MSTQNHSQDIVMYDHTTENHAHPANESQVPHLPAEMMLMVLHGLVKVKNPLTQKTFPIAFQMRALKYAKAMPKGWYRGVVGIFYQENTIRVDIPQGARYNQVTDEMVGQIQVVYQNWLPSSQVANQICNLQLHLSVNKLQEWSAHSSTLALRAISSKHDECLGLLFTLNDPAFDMAGSNMPPLYRFTRTLWQEAFTSLKTLKLVLNVNDGQDFCFAAQNFGTSHLDQLKLTLAKVHVELQHKSVDVELHLQESWMQKCECGCFAEVEELIAAKIVLKTLVRHRLQA